MDTTESDDDHGMHDHDAGTADDTTTLDAAGTPDDTTTLDAAGTPDEDDRTVAKIYYADDQPVQVDAAFIIEGWDWVVGFDQVETDGHDYVSIPADRVVGVMSPLYTQFSKNGRRVTAYGIDEHEVEEYTPFLPL